MEHLRLNYTDVADNGMKQLAGFDQACRFWISRERTLPMPGWRRLPLFTELRELYLNHARFTDKGLALLKPLQKLERLECYGPAPTNDGVAVAYGPEESVGGETGLYGGGRQGLWNR